MWNRERGIVEYVMGICNGEWREGNREWGIGNGE